MFEQDFEPLVEERPGLGRIALIPWDMETFGFGVADFVPGETRSVAQSAPLIARGLERWAREKKVELVGTTLDARDIGGLSLFQSIGFVFIDLTLEVRHADLKTARRPPADGTTIAPATEADLAKAAEICKGIFANGRYHADSRFPQSLADRRYQDWVRRTASPGNPQTLLVVKGQDSIVALAIVEIDGQKGYLHLNAVAPEWQGRGMGVSHIASVLEYLGSRGATRMDSKISAANTAAMSVHARFGARFEKPRVLLHWHAPWAEHLTAAGAPSAE